MLEIGSVSFIDLTGDYNKPPVFFSASSFTIYENTTTVGIVNAGSDVTYSLHSGADVALFSINSISGVLSFKNAPNFEQPLDSNADNIYQIVVRAAKGSLYAFQDISINVLDAPEGPVFQTSDKFNILSETTFVGHVFAGEGVEYTIVDGPDKRLLAIDLNSGELFFKEPTDYYNPIDADENNIYEILVHAQQGGLVESQYILITVVRELPRN